jgi:uncharacterized small protein (DUF1192 family)
MDEEEARPRPKPEVARDLRPMSVVELEAYIAQLRAEMARVEAEVGKRKDVRSAADALFRPRRDPAAG